MILALFLVTVAVGPASAQVAQQRDDASQPADTDQGDLIWNLVGLLGLIGLIGLLPQHEEDSYHPTSFDE
jgi:hypothetical protein